MGERGNQRDTEEPVRYWRKPNRGAGIFFRPARPGTEPQGLLCCD